MKLKEIAIVVLISVFLLPAFSFGQDEDPPKVQVPDQVMKQVEGRILRWYFKPTKRLRKIRISEEGIKEEWLPKIDNIEFVLVSSSEAAKSEKGPYFFKHPENSGRNISIDFGYGDVNCEAYGETWKFRVVGKSAKLWGVRGQW